MKKTEKAYIKRVRNLIIVFALTAVVVSVSTYAWFIGMRTVSVTSFDVEIAGTDSLLLSLTGEPSSFGQSVTINKGNHVTASYTGNTNWWAGNGLKPMSSIGVINPDSSKLNIFEKASLTATPGGYRLLASQIENATSEKEGYVAFDLFVKNFTGANYIKALDQRDEEAIYLTVDSEVKVSSSGVANTGIENSVRVAFAEIGRVIGTETVAATIQNIDCNVGNTVDAVTGICRAAQVWEPNDTKHVVGAISTYETACRKRTGLDLTLDASYTGAFGGCGTFVEGLSYPTYAINQPIISGSNVDIYDGAVYNGYTANTFAPTTNEGGLLSSINYFTDTMKFLVGTQRPTFITLAPNSITKLRIYIYIEGQDIDNYDFASIGKQISVAFGFTKQRFTEDDINYTGPNLNQGTGPLASDLTAPRITLVGDSLITITKGTPYADQGASAVDLYPVETPLTVVPVRTIGTVNVNVPGTYKITYKASDIAGNLAIKTRTIIVTE